MDGRQATRGRRPGLGTALATLLAPVSWGTTYVVITELLPPARPLLVASMRVLPAGLLLVALGALRRPSGSPGWRPSGREWGRSGLLALFNFGLFFPLLVAAVYRLPGGVAAAVGGLQPLLVATVAWMLNGRRPQGRELAVGVAAAVGVTLVVLRPGAAFDTVGLLAAAGANASFAIGVVLTKRFPTPANRLASTGWQLLLGGVLLIPLTLAVEGLPASVDGQALAGFAYLSLGATALAFLLWFNGVRRLPTAAAPLLGLAAPVTGAVLGWLILGQSLSPLQLTGFALTLTAIAYGTTLGAPPTSTPASTLPATPTLPASATPATPTSSVSLAVPAVPGSSVTPAAPVSPVVPGSSTTDQTGHAGRAGHAGPAVPAVAGSSVTAATSVSPATPATLGVPGSSATWATPVAPVAPVAPGGSVR